MRRVSRQPPAVSYPLRRSTAFAVVLGSLLVLGFCALAAWSVEGAGTVTPPKFGAWIFWCLAAVGALQCWRHQFCGALHWDGHLWHLVDLGPKGVLGALSAPPEVLLDMQTHLWVSVLPAGRRRIWLWLERSSQPERWMDLRRAVYSRARPGADNADETAPATSRGV
ncbi:MAG: hypothetical protein KKF51_19185 [Gammaproteobacteria bacterium]|nr:hypothetical protein [Gammaproteobacteria bacterium]